EQDVQKRLQQMLGAMVGMDRVVVSVTADIDFSKENRAEELVDPVDVDNMEGTPVSIETIRETFEGTDSSAGVVGTGEEDIPNYPASVEGQDGDYELVKDTINYELNRINREIVEAPYKIRDLGVQVVIDSVVNKEEDQVQLLTQQEQNAVEEGVASILDSIITTSIDKEFGEIETADKISIVFQQFNNQNERSGDMPTTHTVPLWVYIVGATLLAVIVLLIILLLKSKKEEKFEEDSPSSAITYDEHIPDLMAQPKSESDMQHEQLEKMAKENPEDFAKLLRSWISDD